MKVTSTLGPKHLSLRSVSRWCVVVVMAGIIMLLMHSDVLATYTQPKSRDDIGDGHGTSHWSRILYFGDGFPTTYLIDHVHYGGRKPDLFVSSGEEWRLDKTQYYGWEDGSYVLDTTVTAHSWQSTGSPGLAYWYLNNDVYVCCSKARVKQRLRYKYFHTILNEDIDYAGGYNTHDFF